MNVQKSDSHIKSIVRHLLKTDREFLKEIIKEVLIENEVIAPRNNYYGKPKNQPKPQRI